MVMHAVDALMDRLALPLTCEDVDLVVPGVQSGCQFRDMNADASHEHGMKRFPRK